MNPVRVEARQLVTLHLADAMFGADRSTRRSHQIVHHPRHRFSLSCQPIRTATRARAHVEMHVAIAKVAEPRRLGARKGAFDLRGAALRERPAGLAPVADVAVGDGDHLDRVAELGPLRGRARGLQLGIIRMRAEDDDAELGLLLRRCGLRGR